MSAEIPLKKCLVTGASGFVGKVLCAYLQQQGVAVRALLRNQQAGPWDEMAIGDLKTFDVQNPAPFEGIDTIFYLASIAHNKASVEEYETFNVQVCVQFAKAALNAGVKRFIYVSSTKAMAEPYQTVADETFDQWPQDAYGLSKRRAENELLALNGFEHLSILRPCLIYGAGVQGNLYSMMKWINRGVFPPLPESHAKRSMISVEDVASALHKLAISPIANRKVYIVTDGKAYSVKGIENCMRQALGKNIPKILIPMVFFRLIGWSGDLIKRVLSGFPVFSETVHKLLGPAEYNSKKIQQELGWRPSDTFEDVVVSMVQAYQLSASK